MPTGLSINTITGAITGSMAVGAAANGPYSVTVVAEDGTYSSSQDFTWNVNSPISITTPADQTSSEGATVSLSLSASGGTLTYAALGLPNGLKINPTTGAITGTIAAGDAANGPYYVAISAADGTYSAETTFTWNVNSPVVVKTPDDQTNSQGDTVSLTLSASNTAGGTLTYTATGLPNGLSLNSSTGVISGTVSAGGFWAATATVSNGTYSDTVSFYWTVKSAVSITDPGYHHNQIGDAVSVSVVAADTAAGTLSYSASGLPMGLSINSSTGVISGTVGSGASLTTPYTVTITVGDGTHSAVDTFTWAIGQSGSIVLRYPSAQTNIAGDEVALPLSVSDVAGGTLLFHAVGLPAGLYFNPSTGLIYGTVEASAASATPHSVTVTASDGASSASQTFNWTVNAAGAVSLANPGDQTSAEGATISVALSATDSSGTPTYSAAGLPAGLKVNPNTGVITGTMAVGAAAAGPYTVVVTANDGTNSASQAFAWTVTNPITLAAPGDQTTTEGATVSLSISASGGTLSYAAVGLPPGLKINPSTGAITGTMGKGTAAYGPYYVTVVASDGTYSASQWFSWDATSPITVVVPDYLTNLDGDSASATISATDAAGGTLTYSAEGLPPGLAVNASTGAITGTVAVGDSGMGWFYPTITVSDGTYTGSASFEWDVSGVVTIADLGYQANRVGDTITLLTPATNSGGGTLSFAAAGLPFGLSINASTGLISGTISTGADIVGTYTTTVMASDGTNAAFSTFSWFVAPGGTVTLATPSNQTSAEGATVSLSLSASTTSGGTLHYFTEGLPPGLKINASTGAITGTVAVGDSGYGPYTVMAIATDGTYFAEETFTWTITGPVTVVQPANQLSAEGATASLSISASDSSGDTLHYSAVGLPFGLHINTSTGAITGTIAVDAAEAEQYTVLVTAGDGTYSASATFTWNVGGLVTLTQPASQTNYEGDTVSVSLSATDTTSGTLRYSAVGLPGGLSINTSTGVISGTLAAGTAADGLYPVVVTASDGTYSSSQTFNWYVNDPITIIAPTTEIVTAGSSVTVATSATDFHGGTLTYTAFNLPVGLSINATTGAITGTVSSILAATGYFASKIAVTDGTYSNALSIDWTALGFGLVTVDVVARPGVEETPLPDSDESGNFDGGTTSFKGHFIDGAIDVSRLKDSYYYGTVWGLGEGGAQAKAVELMKDEFETARASVTFGDDVGMTATIAKPADVAKYYWRQTVTVSIKSDDAALVKAKTVNTMLDGGEKYPNQRPVKHTVAMFDRPGLSLKLGFPPDMVGKSDDAKTFTITANEKRGIGMSNFVRSTFGKSLSE